MVAAASPVIFYEFILRGVNPLVNSVLFATSLDVLSVVFMI